MKLTKTVVTGSCLALAFLANCDLIMGPNWKYGETEMRAAVEGTWKLTRGDDNIMLVATQATAAKHSARGFVKSAAACGSRSFVKEAAACVDATRMPLDLVADGHKIAEAELVVDSTTFTQGMFRFELDGASVYADVDPNGAVKSVALYTPGKDTKETVTLERVAK